MKWYRSFQKQGVECRKAGNQFKISFPHYSNDLIICVPFKTYCHSAACREVEAVTK